MEPNIANRDRKRAKARKELHRGLPNAEPTTRVHENLQSCCMPNANQEDLCASGLSWATRQNRQVVNVGGAPDAQGVGYGSDDRVIPHGPTERRNSPAHA